MNKDDVIKIMIVDDNERMREVIKDSLSTIPCSIIECSNGKEAVDGYDRLLPDCVLMDVMMKPMSGITALTEIKKYHPEAKVIMVTNSVEDEVSVASFKAGATAFLHKESLSLLSDLIKNNILIHK
ncbi:MAG: response regulator transcription factor [Bacteroidota bacterium]